MPRRKIYSLTYEEAQSVAWPDNYTVGESPFDDTIQLTRINTAWKILGHRHGFDWTTVAPLPNAQFSAIPLRSSL